MVESLGIRLASKKQTPFSVWYPRHTRSHASGSFTPQRSRRLSASGIGGEARVRLSYLGPQRSRRLSASGIPDRELTATLDITASKKQTPFSVWYGRPKGRMLPWDIASKKQTPFSVWYAAPFPEPPAREPCLKEADAFQRLVYYPETPTRFPCSPASKKQTPFSVWYTEEAGVPFIAPFTPQRSRRLSASGIIRRRFCRPRRGNASKKQTPFSVWYGWGNPPPRMPSLRGNASKKQTPFSVWYA